jgi:hypothetical protein
MEKDRIHSMVETLTERADEFTRAPALVAQKDFHYQ